MEKAVKVGLLGLGVVGTGVLEILADQASVGQQHPFG